ncbi:hypothetical protein [Thermoactinospora rubra]|uniref:hypothetical protein n=1 Tax=Thermoactinospora rubra TaxID=1088767 RepID=UPI000A122510|nr:hypothetical protein [Thermoactinospora rubra]
MLKQILVGGAAIASLAVAAPAFADGDPGKDIKINTASASGNAAVCGNRGAGNVTVPIITLLAPIGTISQDSVTCSVGISQE